MGAIVACPSIYRRIIDLLYTPPRSTIGQFASLPLGPTGPPPRGKAGPRVRLLGSENPQNMVKTVDSTGLGASSPATHDGTSSCRTRGLPLRFGGNSQAKRPLSSERERDSHGPPCCRRTVPSSRCRSRRSGQRQPEDSGVAVHQAAPHSLARGIPCSHAGLFRPVFLNRSTTAATSLFSAGDTVFSSARSLRARCPC